MLRKFQLNKIGKTELLIAYKLLHDTLFILLVFFIGSLIGEGLLPGIVSSHVGLYKVLIAVLLNILAINTFSRKLEINPAGILNKKTAFVLLFIIIALLFNSMLRISLVLNLSILLFTAGIFYFFYKSIFPGRN